MSKDLKKIRDEIERYREKIKYDTLDFPIEALCRRFKEKKLLFQIIKENLYGIWKNSQS